jgi:hypothetical protein
MKHTGYRCDGCGKDFQWKAPVTLTGNWRTSGSGILLPRLDYDFCSGKCLRDWLAKARLNDPRED